MSRIVLLVAIALTASTTSAQVLALTDATVIDVAAGVAEPGMTVVVEDGRITAVGESGGVGVPAAATVVDASGKYLIPGLWDMHAHLEWGGWDTSELLVAHGITGARDLWGDLADIERRSRPATGDTIAPRVVMAGAIVDGAPSMLPGTVSVTTPEQGRAVVDSLADGGAPFIKVYDALSPETYAAIVARSQERGLPVAGHVPWRMRAVDASEAGQKSIEHAFGVLPACSPDEDASIANSAEAFGLLASGDMPGALQVYLRNLRLMGTPDDAACRQLAERLADNGTWVVPTLVVLRGSWLRDDPAFRDDDRLAHVPPNMREGWLPENGFPSRFLSPDDWGAGHAMYARAVEVVGLLHAAGVPLLAGSDAGNPFTFFGSGLHDELELLVEAGLSPVEALRTATSNPAAFLGRADDFGAVAPGKVADLVLLDANPLDDISNVRAVSGVVLDGVWVPEPKLDRVLEATAARFDTSDELSEPG